MTSGAAGGSGPVGAAKHWPAELDIRFANPFFCGQGGMGRVWAAYDTVQGQEIAVKILREDVGQYAEARERFWAEAARMQQVPPHPHVIEVFDYGMIGDWCFLTMPLLSGPHVGAMDLLVPDALEVIQQTADGLAHLHAHGVVHRDIKPSNLVFDSQPDEAGGLVKIVDFGIAKAVDVTPITKTTSGTEGYMAPELRHPSMEVTPACDIYSLGCVLHTLLTGSVPGTPHRSGHDIPPGLQPLLAVMLAEDPTARPDAHRVRREVAAILAETVHHRAAVPNDEASPEPAPPEPVTTMLAPHPHPPTAAMPAPTAMAPRSTEVAPRAAPEQEPTGVRAFGREWFTARGQFGREQLTRPALVVAAAAWLAVVCGGGWVIGVTVLFLLRLVGLP